MKKPKSLNKNYMRSICQLEGWDWKGETITVEDDGMTAYRCYKLTQKSYLHGMKFLPTEPQKSMLQFLVYF